MAGKQEYTYELGRFTRASTEFPHGQWVVYVKRTGKARQRFGLGIALTEPQSRAEARKNEWVRRRAKALFDESGETIDTLAQLYFSDRLDEGKSVEKEQRLWRANLSKVFGHLKAEDINMGVTVEGKSRTVPHKYAFDRQAAGIRRATIYHELNILRTILSWAAKPRQMSDGDIRAFITETPVWLPRRGGPRDTKMTFEQLRRLMAECKTPHLKLFVILAVTTGQRKTAILELTWDRVDFERLTINFRVDRDDDCILDAGGRKGRSKVDMAETAFHALRIAKQWAMSDHVIEYQGKPVKDVHQALKRAMVRAGIDGKFYGAHAIRHSIATLVADKGIDLRQIQKLLGHEDFGTTDRIYAGHSPGYLRASVEAIEQGMAEPERNSDMIDITEKSSQAGRFGGSLNRRKPEGS